MTAKRLQVHHDGDTLTGTPFVLQMDRGTCITLMPFNNSPKLENGIARVSRVRQQSCTLLINSFDRKLI